MSSPLRSRSEGGGRYGLVGRLFVGTLVAGALVLLGCAPAFAGVLWRLDSSSAPTYLVAGSQARIIATASNLGDTEVVGDGAHPVTLSDRLPGHLRVSTGVAAGAIEAKLEAPERTEAKSYLHCSIEEPARKEISCQTTVTTQPLAPYTELKIVIPVELEGGAASGEQNTVSVAGGEDPGGGEPPATPPYSRAIIVNGESTPFGVERFELVPEEEDGSTDVRAGSHPFQLTTTLDLNETLAPLGEGQAVLNPAAAALARNLSFELPPGLLGDPQAVPQCSDVDFSSIGANNVNACPADTAIGVALVTLTLPSPPLPDLTEAVPVFNITPAPGEPARFGFEDTQVPIILDTAVRTSGDYGVSVNIRNTTQAAQLLSSRVTLWGQPDSASHDSSRGWACLHNTEVNGETCTPPTQRSSIPFLTLPTSCLGELATAMNAQAWNGATTDSDYTLQNGLGEPLASLQNCEDVPFTPEISVQPVEEHEGQTPGAAVTSASTPTGVKLNIGLPAEENGLGEAAVRSTSVALPAGVQLSPSAANGLTACSLAQIGYQGPGAVRDPFAPGAPEPSRFSPVTAACPEASKVGLARIKSPDLAHELEGGVYIAEQDNNPFGSLFALYIAAEDPVSGVRVKLAGEVSLNEATGQISTTFKDTPQVPFEHLSLRFFEGPRASLSTPPLCGTYTTLASFTPWSSPTPLTRETGFPITSGPDGTGCSDPLALQPGFQAGSTDAQAGAFTSFTLTIKNPDGDQQLSSLTMHLPAGIAAILASVTPCPEPQAAQEQCGPESLIGHSVASSGLGSEPYQLPGQVYLTGAYKGAPFGIEIVTPAIAGPFNLGNVTVRSTINVNPNTAAVTITSDPIPTRVKGVPAQIKQLNVTIDRPGFQFNPTSCEPKQIEGTIAGSEGATVPVSSPFQAQNCQGLPFEPKLTATAGGHGSKADGTSFAVTVTSGGVGPSGVAQAGIAKVDLQLPVALSSRLSTLQKACPEAAFNANPASCDEGSVIGYATIHTPVLANPLSGPAYLVSHGGAAFPDVEFVLQGEGITLVLDGKTDIKAGVTYSRFESAPDAPFTVFETVLPAGPHGVLTANVPEREDYSLCKASLAMPTEITGQNGTVINETTNIAASGCGGVLPTKTVKLTRAQLLARALKACKRKYKHSHSKRVACEKQARKHYAAKKADRKTAAHRAAR